MAFGNTRALSRKIETLQGKMDALGESLELKREVEALKIERSKIEEDFARERREIEHKLGLEKRRQEADLEAAIKGADARERWQKQQEEQFDEKLDWFKEQTAEHQKLSKEILSRLPKITVKGAF
jgi:hypothetical protein